MSVKQTHCFVHMRMQLSVEKPHLISIHVHCQEDQRGVMDTERSEHWPDHFARSAPTWGQRGILQ